jgi:membrane associated rhomboid family serine protease
MLILLPLNNRIEWRHAPVITLTLILVNAVIFYALQGNDNKIDEQASKYYFESGLAQYESEVYPKFLENQKENETLLSLQHSIRGLDPVLSAAYLQSYTDLDYAYQKAITNGRILNISDKLLQNTRKHRQQYQKILSKSTYRNYSLRPAQPTWVTFLTHMFLHADSAHLWGNMLFLFLVGFSVETILGGKIFFLMYLGNPPIIN